jgi:hypothetical protein
MINASFLKDEIMKQVVHEYKNFKIKFQYTILDKAGKFIPKVLCFRQAQIVIVLDNRFR